MGRDGCGGRVGEREGVDGDGGERKGRRKYEGRSGGPGVNPELRGVDWDTKDPR